MATTDPTSTWHDPADGSAVARLLGSLHPAPDLPLQQPFTAGLGPLLSGLGDLLGGALGGHRATAVTRLVGPRYSVAATPEGVRSHGLVRSRFVAWADVECVQVEPLTALLAGRVLTGTAGRLAGRALPIPGLRWLIRQAASGVGDRIAEAVGSVGRSHVPATLVAVRSRGDGDDILLDGPLALASALSRGLTVAVLHEADRRGIPVVRA